MEDKDIVLDEKTRGMVINNLNQIKILQDKLETILQTVVNVKFPDSKDEYELTKDATKLVCIKGEGQP